MPHNQIKLIWVAGEGKTGVGHSYRNKAKGWISGSDGCQESLKEGLETIALHFRCIYIGL